MVNFLAKELIVFTESSHFVLLRFLPDIRTSKPILGFTCSCQGRFIKVCDVHASKLAEHLRLFCLGKYKKSPAKKIVFAKDE